MMKPVVEKYYLDMVLVNKNGVASKGFTMVEMVIVLSIIGILLLLGGQAYTNWLFRTKSQELSFDLQRSLSQARSAAIRYGDVVRLCGSNDGSQCTSTFQNGWIVFLDSDRDGQVSSTETVMRVNQNGGNAFTIAVKRSSDSDSISAISFNHKGYADVAFNVGISGRGMSENFAMTRAGYVH